MCAACTVGSTGSILFALDGFCYLLISHFVLLFVQVDGRMLRSAAACSAGFVSSQAFSHIVRKTLWLFFRFLREEHKKLGTFLRNGTVVHSFFYSSCQTAQSLSTCPPRSLPLIVYRHLLAPRRRRRSIRRACGACGACAPRRTLRLRSVSVPSLRMRSILNGVE